MPPKVKFSREEIVDAAFAIARERGIEAVVAREVGRRLGTSASPIFTIWHSMEELREEVRMRAMAFFRRSTADALSYTPAYKQFGKQMIAFTQAEPKLFQLLFMRDSDHLQSFEEATQAYGSLYESCQTLICRDYEVSPEEARLLFRQTWIFTLGICVLIANRVCRFSDEEIETMLGHTFVGTLLLIKSGGLTQTAIHPTKRGPDTAPLEKMLLDVIATLLPATGATGADTEKPSKPASSLT